MGLMGLIGIIVVECIVQPRGVVTFTCAAK